MFDQRKDREPRDRVGQGRSPVLRVDVERAETLRRNCRELGEEPGPGHGEELLDIEDDPAVHGPLGSGGAEMVPEPGDGSAVPDGLLRPVLEQDGRGSPEPTFLRVPDEEHRPNEIAVAVPPVARVNLDRGRR